MGSVRSRNVTFGDYLQIMNRCMLPGNIYEPLYEQIQSQVLSTVKWTLKQALDEEVHNDLECGRYEQCRRCRRGPEDQPAGHP